MRELWPDDLYKYGVQRAWAVDRRCADVSRALVDLRIYGSAGALVDVVGRDVVGDVESVDGLRGLPDRLRDVLFVGAEFGLGLYARFWSGLGERAPVVDASDGTFSPTWLEAAPWLPWSVHDASLTLLTTDWRHPMAVEDEDAAFVDEALREARPSTWLARERNRRRLSDDERAARADVFARWEVALRKRVEVCRIRVAELALAGATFVTFDDENLFI
jgi:hypothetical protein